jgi:hypothetical protein
MSAVCKSLQRVVQKRRDPPKSKSSWSISSVQPSRVQTGSVVGVVTSGSSVSVAEMARVCSRDPSLGRTAEEEAAAA